MQSFSSFILFRSWKPRLKFLTWEITPALLAKKSVCFCLPTCSQVKISDPQTLILPWFENWFHHVQKRRLVKVLNAFVGNTLRLHEGTDACWPKQPFCMVWAKNHGHVLSSPAPHCTHSETHCQAHSSVISFIYLFPLFVDISQKSLEQGFWTCQFQTLLPLHHYF